MLSATSTLLTAPSGTGKSYWVVYELVELFLKEHQGKYITNLPLGVIPETHSTPPSFEGETFADRIGKYVNPTDPASVADRIELLEADELESWRNGFGGPWETFKDRDLTDCVIVIDECHNYAAVASHKATRLEWQKWCGELRHQGAKVLFITQSPLKLCREIRHECGVRQALINQEERLDPFLNIKLFYWYQLRAKWSGEYTAKFVRMDLRDIDGEKTETGKLVSINRNPFYFQFYDSFNAPSSGVGHARGAAELQPWQKYSWPKLVSWFVKHNSYEMLRPAIFVCVLLSLGVGGPWFFRGIVSAMDSNGEIEKSGSSELRPGGVKSVVPLKELSKAELSELERLREAQEAYKRSVMESAVFTTLSPTRVGLACGVTYGIGDVIGFGMLAGMVVDEINYSERFVVVSGVRVYLGKWWAEQYTAPTSGVSGETDREAENVAQ